MISATNIETLFLGEDEVGVQQLDLVCSYKHENALDPSR
jgi:hypothetical protein